MEKALFRVVGRVKKEREYSLNDLLAMDTFETGDLLLACGSGEPKGLIPKCRGVRLTDIINRAELVTAGHNDTKKMYLEVVAEDGYCTVFSWQELFNTVVGEGVMVILEKDGKKIHEKHGGVDLFSSCDILTGPRYVKKLDSINIVMVKF